MNAGKLATRVLEPELMDDPQLAPDRHREALQSLARINRVARSARIVWGPVRQLARRLGRSSLSVLDIASGAGDLPLDLCRRGERAGLRLRVLGVDISREAVDFASRRAEGSSADVAFQQLNVLDDPLPAGFDVVTCSLFLHHLSQLDARRLLEHMGRAAEQLVVVSDLRRCRLGYWAAYAASRLLTRSEVVHVDAVRSVCAALTADEARSLAQQADLPAAVVRRRFPFRYVIVSGGRA